MSTCSTYKNSTKLLVFWVPHIYWRRLYGKEKKILEDSAVRNMHMLSLSTADTLMSTATEISDSELISDWDFERVLEFFLPEEIVWIVRMILLKI